MKRVATYTAIVVAMLLMVSGVAFAENASVDAEATMVPATTPEASPAPSADDASPQPTFEPSAEPTLAPTQTAEVEPTPTLLPEDEAQARLEDVALSMDSMAIELDISNAQRVRIAELDALGLSDGMSVDWYISSYTGDAVSVDLEPVEYGQGVYVYASANSIGQSEYEITCRFAIGSESRELSARLTVTVCGSTETVPAKFEGIELIYRLGIGETVKIEPTNASSFPQGTQWSLTSRKAGLAVENESSSFAVSSQRAGRYIALMTAVTPEDESRMAYIMFDVGNETVQYELALNFTSIDITLDMHGANTDAAYFIQPSDALAYLPAEWTLTADGTTGSAQLRIEPMLSGAMLYASPVKAGVDQYTLTCYIPSLERSTSIPVSVKVRDNASGVTGIAFKKAQYSLRLDEAITLSPYVLPQGESCPEGTLWTAYQIGDSASHLSLSVNEQNGQTTVLAFRPGVYTIEFAAQVSANRIYTTTLELIVTK